MIRYGRRFIRARRTLGLFFAIVMVLGIATVPATGQQGQGQGQDPSTTWSFQGENDHGHEDIDNRDGVRRPTKAQRNVVAALGAEVHWNTLGTPRSLIKHGGWLAQGLGSNDEAAARRFISNNRSLFLLSEAGVADLELTREAAIGKGAALSFQQRFGGLLAAPDGRINLGVKQGKISFVSSSIAPSAGVSASELAPKEALLIAADDAELSVDADDLSSTGTQRGWDRFKSEELTHTQLVRLVAVPTPQDSIRAAYQTFVFDNGAEPTAFTHFIDAETGAVLIRSDDVDHAQEEEEDDPSWSVFPNTPPLDYSSTDTREVWCWFGDSDECERILENDAARVPWDVDARTGLPTFTSRGNQARTTENWHSFESRTIGINFATPRPERDYEYDWTNQWYEERCNPDTTFTSPERNDIDAAIGNLFAMHNRMHDWSYFLGFTEVNYNLQDFNFDEGGRENDPEHGNAQAGGVVGGPPLYRARDNANQITPPDGSLPITNMYLWQPIPGGFYSPCVDGDYDMSVIGHEYTHAITNRMVGGPDAGLSGPQAGAMGESWSDLVAVEYLHENDFVPVADENPFAVGPYVTGDKNAGIRNYGMNDSPLNYSNIGYDITGPQVHADGEIWSATNYEIREDFNDRYDGAFPSNNATLQEECADGEREANECPGNRRWTQIMFDSYLLMPSAVSMVDARNALIAADQLRFNGVNADLLWRQFAKQGLGQSAFSAGNADPDPIPGYDSPFADEATVTFRPTGQGEGRLNNAELFLGHYEARSTPVADTDPSTETDNSFELIAGKYDFIARADGFGMKRFTVRVRPGQNLRMNVFMRKNIASLDNGAAATGDGVNHDELIDDTEETNWASRDGEDIRGSQVTVELDPSKRQHQIQRVQVSALLRPAANPPDPTDPDDGPQSRFSALRQFEIHTCRATNQVDCTEEGDFRLVLTSPDDAFPAIAPRPRAPELIMRSFKVKRSQATHVRIVVLENQCTGTPDYRGDQDDDPRHNTDCVEGSTQDTFVRAAELQVFTK